MHTQTCAHSLTHTHTHAHVYTQEYRNARELWEREQKTNGGFDSWYTKAVQYWDEQEPSYNGVLGGYGYVSDVDVHDSRQLLEKVC